MATEAQNLQAGIDNVTAKLAAITADPKPNYSVDGQAISWGEYYGMLVKLRNDLKAALVNAEGPFEHHITAQT